jgi:hypothetical protein
MLDLLLLLAFAGKGLVSTYALISFNVFKDDFTAELEVFAGTVILEDFLDEFSIFSGLLLCDCVLVLFVKHH